MNHRAIEPLKQAVARGAILALAAALLLLGCASCSSPGRGLPLTVLLNDLEPLRTEFNQVRAKSGCCSWSTRLEGFVYGGPP